MERPQWRALTALILVCTVFTPVSGPLSRAGSALCYESSIVAAHPGDQGSRPNASQDGDDQPRPTVGAVDEAVARRGLASPVTPGIREAQLQATGVYTPHLVPAQPSSPLVPLDAIKPQDPDAAAARIKVSLARLAQAAASTSSAAYTPPTTWEIQALAEAWDDDPRLIYEYVHNHYDYVPTWGLSQSPHDTYLSKIGNAFDQSTLLLALLQAAGYQAEYAFGEVEIPLDQVRNWLGIQDQQTLDDAMFGYGGIPGRIDGSVVRMDHVWVRVRVGGEWHPLDPSFKSYANISGIDLAQALGYNRATFVAAAEQGAQITADYVKDINEAEITSLLTQYATNLMDYLRQNAPFAYLSEVVGGREIAPISVDDLPTQLPYTVVEALGQSASMPSEHVNKWHFELPGIDFTAYFPDIIGKRVTLFYYGATQMDRDRIASAGGIFNVYPAHEVNMKPHLAIGGQVVAMGDAAPLGTTQPVAFSIVSAVLDPEGNPYTLPYRSDDGTLHVGEWYAFPLSAPRVSPQVLDRQNRILMEHLVAGEDDESEAVLGQSLHLTGLSWLNEVEAATVLDNHIADTVPVPHWQAIIMSQDVQQEWAQVGGQWKVVQVYRASHTIHAASWALAVFSATGDADPARAVQTHTLLRASAAEGAIWQQLQSAPAVSMVSLLDLATSERSRIYHLTASNLEAVLPLLDFPESFKQNLRNSVAVGYEVFVPEDPLSVDAWYGVGWTEYDPGSGGLNSNLTGGIGWGSAQGGKLAWWSPTSRGGSVTVVAPFDPSLLGMGIGSGIALALEPGDNNDPDSGKTAGPDVVDTATGAFLYQARDLAFGVLGHPIRLERFYVSENHLTDGPLGHGWTHSYQLGLVESSDWMRGSGFRSATDAVGAIAESYVSLDLIATDAQLHQQMVIGCTAAAWALDGLTDNVVTLTGTEGRRRQYVQLPDGSYRPPASLFGSLTSHPDGTYTLKGKDGSRIGFDALGRGASMEDANGNQISLTYDVQGNLIRVTDAAGRSIDLSYTDGYLTEINDPAGRTLQYTYDLDGNLAHYTDARGGTTSYSYDSDRRMTSVTDPEGLTVVENTYDELGRVRQQTDGRGGTATFGYGDVRTAVTDPTGYETLYRFDRYARLVGKQDALGYSTSIAYDANDNVLSRTDANGSTATYAYDARSNLTRITDPLGHSTLFTYDAQDNLTGVTDPLGRATHWTYDAHRNPTSITDPLGQTTTLSYNARGQLIALTDTNGHTTTFSHDGHGNLSGVTDALGHTTSLAYDTVGRLTSLTDPNGHATAFAYDAGDYLVSAADPLGHERIYTYDRNRLLISVTDARDHVTWYGHDAQFNLTSVTDALGRVTRYAYDANDHLIMMTDANSHNTHYQRDAVGQLTRITDPLGRATHFAYDPNGNRVTRTKADGNVLHYQYDANDRLTQVSYPDGSAVSYTYDATGNVTRSSYGTWQAEYAYDALNRLMHQDLPGEGVSIAYTYDPTGNPLSIEAQRDGTLLYQVHRVYDAADRLSQIVDGISDQTINWAYDAAGNVTSIDYASGARTAYTYDAKDRITAVENLDGEGGTMSAWAYTYDEVNNPLQVTRNTPGRALATSYTYDALDRLIRESYPRYSVEYDYDALGNRTRVVSPLGTVEYAYDAADQLLSAGPTTFTYDANGNQTTRIDARGITIYSYDHQDRLIRITAPGNLVTDFSYDAVGQRVGMTGPGGASRFIYDGFILLLEEGSGSSHSTAYLYGNGLLAAGQSLDPGSGAMEIAYHGDGLGSVVNISDGTGMPRGASGFDAFGHVSVAAGGDQGPYRFLGQLGVRAEEAVGDLYLMRFRTYDASTGRFISPDPVPGGLRNPATSNRYTYAFNNPLRFVDPTGLRPEPWQFGTFYGDSFSYDYPVFPFPMGYSAPAYPFSDPLSDSIFGPSHFPPPGPFSHAPYGQYYGYPGFPAGHGTTPFSLFEQPYGYPGFLAGYGTIPFSPFGQPYGYPGFLAGYGTTPLSPFGQYYGYGPY